MAGANMRIGYFDNETETAVHDEADHCAICGAYLDQSREAIALLIHCTRWPLATFVRVHRDEANFLTTDHEQRALITAQALEERERIEGSRIDVPSVFRDAFS